MNIFYLDSDPAIAAQDLMDVHVRKMILESCQLLMTHDTLTGHVRPYLPTHTMHPCRLALKDVNNYNWLCIYLGQLCKEFQYRFGHKHACEDYYNFFYSQPCVITGVQNFPQCMPDEFKCENTIEAYRAYYRAKQFDFMLNGMAKYTNRNIPDWL